MSRFTPEDIAKLPPHLRNQVDAAFLSTARRIKGVYPTESQSQQAVIRWWAIECEKHSLPEKCLKAFPLQGARTKKNGARLKAEGMRAGTLDMFLGVPRGPYHGLWIELKTPVGVLSPAQKEMLKLELSQGYATVVCRGADEAKAVITAYLKSV